MRTPEEIIGYFWHDHALYRGTNTLIMVRIEDNGQMDCCGTAALRQIGHAFISEEDKQNFAYMLMEYINTNYSYLFIANDSQLYNGRIHSYGNVASLLCDLGAREVDDSKNRNWGFSRMHLHVWNPTKLCGGALRKYLHIDKDGSHTPLWYHQLDEEGKAKALEAAKIKWVLIQQYKENLELRRKNSQHFMDMKSVWRIHETDQFKDFLKGQGWVKANEQQQQPNVSTSPRLDALRRFVNEIIIVNEAEYAKSN